MSLSGEIVAQWEANRCAPDSTGIPEVSNGR